jgi:hypothetical protein
MFSKTAFCFTLLRVVTRFMKAVVWFVIVSMNLIIALAIVILLAQCRPVEAGWNPFVRGDCWPAHVAPRFGIFASGNSLICILESHAFSGVFSGLTRGFLPPRLAYSVAMDFFLVGLVWNVIMGLQMKTVEKYGVAVGMSMGVV